MTTDIHPAVSLYSQGRSRAEIGYALSMSYREVSAILRAAGVPGRVRRLPPDRELLAMVSEIPAADIARRYAVSPASVSAALKRARARAAA